MTIPSAIVTMVFPFGERMAAGGGGRGDGGGGEKKEGLGGSSMWV